MKQPFCQSSEIFPNHNVKFRSIIGFELLHKHPCLVSNQKFFWKLILSVYEDISLPTQSPTFQFRDGVSFDKSQKDIRAQGNQFRMKHMNKRCFTSEQLFQFLYLVSEMIPKTKIHLNWWIRAKHHRDLC